MTFLKQSSLLALAACLGLSLVGCQPSDPNSPNVKQLTSIAVTPNPVNLEIGGVRALTVTGTLEDDSTYVVSSGTTFTSSAPAVATVAPDTGYVTAVAAGSATITARHTESGLTATTAITVSPLRVTSIAVSPASRTLEPDASLALTVTATYNNATTGDVTSTSTFVSSDPAVAAVDATGVVTAVALGTATITATHTPSGNTAEAAITVAESSDFNTITFDELGVTYELRGFGGAEDSTLQLDPTNATNTVARVNRSATAADFAGTVVSTGPNETVGTIPFSATNTRMTVRVYSPAAGIRVLLKVEDSTDVNRFAQTQAFTTMANAWETLTFDFANPFAGSPALDLSYNYDRLIIFFNFGVTGATAGAQTFYFDDMTFVSGGATAPTDAPTTVIPADAVTIYSDAASVAGLDPFPDWGQNPPVTRSEVTIAGNESLQYIWPGPGGLYQGLDWNANPVDVSTKSTLHIDFWSPDITSVRVSIIGGGRENAYTQALTTGGWNGVDIDLSNYTEPDKTAIIQIKLEPATPGTLYVDNIYFWGTAGGGGGFTPITFDSAAVTYTLTGFGGAEDATVVADPTNAGNNVARVVKSATAQLWAGTTVSTGPNSSVDTIPFTATSTRMTVRVYSPRAGIPVRLKVEDAADPTRSVETEALTTQVNTWETLTFDFANQAAGTAALNLAFTYNKASIFFDFGTAGADGGGGTFYFDDVTFQ